MEQRIPVENKSAMPIYVAGLMIPPGETRHFSKDQVPREFWPVEAAPEPEPEADPFVALLEHKVADVVAALATMATADVERLGELEQAKGDGARKTLLAAIAEELLTRAGNPPAKNTEQIIAELPSRTDEELAQLVVAATDNGEEALVAAINAEIDKRKG